MKNVFSLFNVEIKSYAMQDALKEIVKRIEKKKKTVVSTVNTEIIMMCKENNDFKKIIDNSDIILPDGIGVVWAGRYLGNEVAERITGFDLAMNLLGEANKKSFSIYFLGAAPGIAETAINNIKNKYPNIIISGYHNGFFEDNESHIIIKEINAIKTDILFVALGAPKQEKWIYKYKDDINVNLFLGIGGSFDVMAGHVKRAPVFMQKMGLEWFYRLFKQPQRFGRMLSIPKFMLQVILNEKK